MTLLSLRVAVPDDRVDAFNLALHSTDDICFPGSWVVATLRPGLEPMNREQLLSIIDDIRARVASGDSMEGSLNYLIGGYDAYYAWEEGGKVGPPPRSDEFDVEARYRVGNLQGQGGMRMIGVRFQ